MACPEVEEWVAEAVMLTEIVTIAVDGQVTIKASDLQLQEVVRKKHQKSQPWIIPLGLKATPSSYLDWVLILLKAGLQSISDKSE